jgi:hypothetical protein
MGRAVADECQKSKDRADRSLFTLFKPKKHTDEAASKEGRSMPTTLRDQGLPLAGRDDSAISFDEKADYLVSRFSRYAGIALFFAALGLVIYLIV